MNAVRDVLLGMNPGIVDDVRTEIRSRPRAKEGGEKDEHRAAAKDHAEPEDTLRAVRIEGWSHDTE